MMKRYLSIFACVILSHAYTGNALAEQNVKLAVHIQQQDYQHPVRIWNWAEGLWIEQGPFLESAANKVFSQLGTQAYAMCQSKVDAANVLVWLRPNLYYNPQVNTFYGKVHGYFYTADGKPLVRLTGESKSVGRFLGEQTKTQIASVYEAAVQDLYQRMQTNAQVTDYLNGQVKGMVTLNPCATAEFLPVSKFRFTTFQ